MNCKICKNKGYIVHWIADKATGAMTRRVKKPCYCKNPTVGPGAEPITPDLCIPECGIE